MCVIFSLLILVGFLHLVEISLLVVLCFLFPVCFSNVKNVKYLMMFFCEYARIDSKGKCSISQNICEFQEHESTKYLLSMTVRKCNFLILIFVRRRK